MSSSSRRTDIVFFHISVVHIDTFNAVREDLLTAAEKMGFVTAAIDLKTQEALMALRDGVAACIAATILNTQAMIRSSAALAGHEVSMKTFVFEDVWGAFSRGAAR